MAVTAQAGTFSFGGQAAKGTISSTFYRHRAVDIDLATLSDDRLGPPEVGGTPTPTIPYRAGVTAAGGATIAPRLESTLGWLLYGTCGAIATTNDEDVLGNTVTGMYNHEFKFATNQSFIPYMSFRKEVPGSASDGSDDLGESFVDCKIINAAFALPNDGLITTRVDVLGRGVGQNFEDNPSWTYDNTFEDYNSIPIGCVTAGYVQIPNYSGTDLPIIAGNVVLTNAPLDMRQEKVFGSPYMEDVTVVSRRLVVDLILKWEDPELYRSILTGATNGTQWTTAPFVEDLDVYTLSADDATGLSTPWGLRFQAPSVMYQVVGGIQLAGNQSVALRVTGTALASSTDYFTVNLGNTTTQYVWPT